MTPLRNAGETPATVHHLLRACSFTDYKCWARGVLLLKLSANVPCISQKQNYNKKTNKSKVTIKNTVVQNAISKTFPPHQPDVQVERHLCGCLQNDEFVCIPSLRIAYERTCGSAKVVYNNTQLN